MLNMPTDRSRGKNTNTNTGITQALPIQSIIWSELPDRTQELDYRRHLFMWQFLQLDWVKPLNSVVPTTENPPKLDISGINESTVA